MNKKMTKIDASLDSKKANAKKRRMGAIAATVAIATGAAAPVVWAINPDEADAEEGTEEEKKIKRAVKNIQENGGYDWEVIDKLLQQFHEKYIELKQHDNSLPAFEQFLSEYFEQYETEKNNLFSHEKNTESDFQLRETVFNYLNDKAESIGISLISWDWLEENVDSLIFSQLSNDDPEAFENLKDKVKEAITRAKSDNATVREFLTNFSKYMQLGDQEIQNEAEIKTNIEAVFSRIKNITLDQTGWNQILAVDGQKPTDSQLFTYKGGDVTRNFYGYEIINGKKSLDFSPIARSFWQQSNSKNNVMVNFSEDDSASVKTTSLYDLVQSELIDKGLIKNSRDNKPLVFLQFKTNDYENKLGFEDNYGDYTTSIDCQIMVVLSPMDFDFNVIPEDLVAVYGMDAWNSLDQSKKDFAYNPRTLKYNFTISSEWSNERKQTKFANLFGDFGINKSTAFGSNIFNYWPRMDKWSDYSPDSEIDPLIWNKLEYQYFSQQLLNYDETKGTGIMKDEFIDELGVTIASLEKPGSSEYTKPWWAGKQGINSTVYVDHTSGNITHTAKITNINQYLKDNNQSIRYTAEVTNLSFYNDDKNCPMAKVEVVVTDKNGDIVAKTTHDSVASAQGLPIHYSETDKVNIRVSTQFVDNYIFGDFKWWDALLRGKNSKVGNEYSSIKDIDVTSEHYAKFKNDYAALSWTSLSLVTLQLAVDIAQEALYLVSFQWVQAAFTLVNIAFDGWGMATSIQEAQRATNAAKPFLGKEGIIQTLKDKRKEFSNLGTVEINYDNFKEHLSAFENAWTIPTVISTADLLAKDVLAWIKNSNFFTNENIMREILKAFYSAMSVFANGKEVASVGEAIESLLDDVAKVKGSVDWTAQNVQDWGVLAGLSGDLAKGVAIAINSLKAINATLNMVKGCFGIAVGAADIAGDLWKKIRKDKSFEGFAKKLDSGPSASWGAGETVKETTISGEAAQAVDDALETPAKLGKITYEQFAKWQKALSLFSLAVTLVNTLFDLAKSIYTSVAQGKLQSELVVLFESW